MNDTVIKTLRSYTPPLCVLSTANNSGKPQSAVLAFVVQDDGSLILSTHHTSRKWKNLEKNNAVSLVFGFGFGDINIQIDGVANLYSEGPKFEEIQKTFFSALPDLEKYRSNDTVLIQVIPAWVRLNDYTQVPPKVEEFSV